MRTALRVSVSIALAVLAPGAGATTLVAPADLEQLVAESERAVLAVVVGVEYGLDERGLHSTRVRLRVEDAVYGALPAPAGELTIKVYGAPVALDGTRVYVDGTPPFRVGERLFLLLRADSAWGFTGAAGLFQGVFRLAPGERGEAFAASLGGNGRVLGPAGLGRWLDPGGVDPAEHRFLEPQDGPVPWPLVRRAVVEIRRRQGAR